MMDFVLMGTNSWWRLQSPQGCTQQEPAWRKQLVSLAPAFDLRESHTTEGRLARSPVRSLRSWRAELCLSVPWAAWSLVRQERSTGCLGLAIRSLHQALETAVLPLGVLTGSESHLLGPRPPFPPCVPAAPLPGRRTGCQRQAAPQRAGLP